MPSPKLLLAHTINVSSERLPHTHKTYPAKRGIYTTDKQGDWAEVQWRRSAEMGVWLAKCSITLDSSDLLKSHMRYSDVIVHHDVEMDANMGHLEDPPISKSVGEYDYRQLFRAAALFWSASQAIQNYDPEGYGRTWLPPVPTGSLAVQHS